VICSVFRQHHNTAYVGVAYFLQME